MSRSAGSVGLNATLIPHNIRSIQTEASIALKHNLTIYFVREIILKSNNVRMRMDLQVVRSSLVFHLDLS
jgi:hypothetical protein